MEARFPLDAFNQDDLVCHVRDNYHPEDVYTLDELVDAITREIQAAIKGSRDLRGIDNGR